MKISLEYGVPPKSFEVEVDAMIPKPIEIKVDPVGLPYSQKQALLYYVASLRYLFMGVNNMVTGNLKKISVERSWFGKIERDGYAIRWEPKMDKFFIVVYSLGDGKLDEDMYVADSVYVDKKGIVDAHPVWLNTLLNPKSKAAETEKEHLRDAIAAVTEFVDVCQLSFENNKLVISDTRKGKRIRLEDISTDEAYILVRLIYRILNKGLHQGVFLIDCRFYSDKIINALSQISTFIYGSSFIFLYNLRPESKVDRSTVVLPNMEVKY